MPQDTIMMQVISGASRLAAQQIHHGFRRSGIKAGLRELSAEACHRVRQGKKGFLHRCKRPFPRKQGRQAEQAIIAGCNRCGRADSGRAVRLFEAQTTAHAQRSGREQGKRIQRLRAAEAHKEHCGSRAEGHSAADAAPGRPHKAEHCGQQQEQRLHIYAKHGRKAEKNAEGNLFPGWFQMLLQSHKLPIYFIDISYYIAPTGNWQSAKTSGKRSAAR